MRRLIRVQKSVPSGGVLYSIINGNNREFWLKTTSFDIKVVEIPLELAIPWPVVPIDGNQSTYAPPEQSNTYNSFTWSFDYLIEADYDEYRGYARRISFPGECYVNNPVAPPNDFPAFNPNTESATISGTFWFDINDKPALATSRRYTTWPPNFTPGPPDEFTDLADNAFCLSTDFPNGFNKIDLWQSPTLFAGPNETSYINIDVNLGIPTRLAPGASYLETRDIDGVSHTVNGVAIANNPVLTISNPSLFVPGFGQVPIWNNGDPQPPGPEEVYNWPYQATLSYSDVTGNYYVLVKHGYDQDDPEATEFKTLDYFEVTPGQVITTLGSANSNDWRQDLYSTLYNEDIVVVDSCLSAYILSTDDALINSTLYEINTPGLINSLKTQSQTLTISLSIIPATSNATCVLGVATTQLVQIPSPGRGSVESIAPPIP